ncbi:hypothetical protein THAOC_25905, partial [Thalassiosira oceanica]
MVASVAIVRLALWKSGKVPKWQQKLPLFKVATKVATICKWAQAGCSGPPYSLQLNTKNGGKLTKLSFVADSEVAASVDRVGCSDGSLAPLRPNQAAGGGESRRAMMDRTSVAARPRWVQGWIACDILAGDGPWERRCTPPELHRSLLASSTACVSRSVPAAGSAIMKQTEEQDEHETYINDAELGRSRGRQHDAGPHLADTRKGERRLEAPPQGRLQVPEREPRRGGRCRRRAGHGRPPGGHLAVQLRVQAGHAAHSRDVVPAGGEEEQQQGVRAGPAAGGGRVAGRAAVPERGPGGILARRGNRRDTEGGGGLGDSAGVQVKPRRSAFLGIGEVQFTLQRGYGQYTIEGEDDENALGDLTHCVFIVHGIGETMWSRQESSTSSIRDDVDTLRSTVNRKKVLTWRDECKRCERQKKPPPPPPNRVEFIPIEWYDKVRSPTHALVESLRAVTINSIPALRAIANDVIFDVLMYLTPEYCRAILECVTNQIVELYSTFQRINPTFVQDGGKMSLMGHSLGSVIVWDVLSVLRESLEGKAPRGTADDPIRIDVPPSPPPSGDESRSESASAATAGLDVLQGTKKWGPPLHKKMDKVIPFVPDLTIFLGSPVGLFLTLRGAHSAFDELRAVAEAERASLIPCDDEEVEVLGGGSGKSNEPPPPVCFADRFALQHLPPERSGRLQDRAAAAAGGRAAERVPPPAFLSPDGKTIRLHTKARQVGNELFRQFGGLSSLIGKSVESSAESAAEADRATEGRRRRKSDEGR